MSSVLHRRTGRTGPGLVLAGVLVAVLVVILVAHLLLPMLILAGAGLFLHLRHARHNRRRHHHHLARDFLVAGLGAAAWRRYHHHQPAYASSGYYPYPSSGYLAPGYAFEAATFEHLSARAWRLQRYGGPGDGGIDLAGTDAQGRAVVVQCKCWGGPIGAPIVRDLLGAASLVGARPVLATTGRLTSRATEACQRAGVEVLDARAIGGDGWRKAGERRVL